MAGIALYDRVIWLGAFNPDGSEKGGWAGNGKGVVASYDPTRRHFKGGPPQGPKEATVGPAVGILLDGGDPKREKKYDVWVDPTSREMVLDPDQEEDHGG